MAMRANALLKRYGLRSAKAERRIIDCVNRLASFGCRPTLPVPGRVVEKYPRFFQHLQATGVELAMHGYDHVDFRGLSRDEISIQFNRATAAFRSADVRFDGFRCPYLGCTNAARVVALESGCTYSSNSAIEWHVIDDGRQQTPVFDSAVVLLSGVLLRRRGFSAAGRSTACWRFLPRSPTTCSSATVCGYRTDDVSRTWLGILSDTHRLRRALRAASSIQRRSVIAERPSSRSRRGVAVYARGVGGDARRHRTMVAVEVHFTVQTTSRLDYLDIAFQCDRRSHHPGTRARHRGARAPLDESVSGR